VYQTLLVRLSAVPTPLLALDVQRGGMPGHPGANVGSPTICLLCIEVVYCEQEYYQEAEAALISRAQQVCYETHSPGES
jgi:hypothetical protein